MDRWIEMEVFVKTAELGSLTRAAEVLELSGSAAGRYLASLESRLGARLIERNTRRSHVTDVGMEYLRRCRSILSDVDEADAVVTAAVIEPTGTLRLTGSLSFCMGYIAPLLPDYHQQHPKVRVHIEAANRYFDLLDSGIDLAIRTREFEPDSNITVRRLAATRRVIAAAPSYLRTRTPPRVPADLVDHNLLLYTYANRPNELLFRHGSDEETIVHVQGLLESNDGQVVRAAALAGLGLLIQPRFVIHDDLAAGRLVCVLDDWDLPSLTINLAYQSRKHLSAKVRTFIDFLVARFQRLEYERKWME